MLKVNFTRDLTKNGPPEKGQVLSSAMIIYILKESFIREQIKLGLLVKELML